MKDIDGNQLSMEKYKGFVTIIVNVACKWGGTEKNYKQLQAIYEKHEQDGLRIAVFPCNQFGGQEPWDEPEIKRWVDEKFHATFDLYSKIKVNGDDADPLYKYLKSKQGGTLFDAIKWNFSKFLIDRNGQPVKRYGPNVEPNDILKDALELLKK